MCGAQPKGIEEAEMTSNRLTQKTKEDWIAGLDDELFEKGRVEEKKKLTRSEKQAERAEYRREQCLENKDDNSSSSKPQHPIEVSLESSRLFRVLTLLWRPFEKL